MVATGHALWTEPVWSPEVGVSGVLRWWTQLGDVSVNCAYMLYRWQPIIDRFARLWSSSYFVTAMTIWLYDNSRLIIAIFITAVCSQIVPKIYPIGLVLVIVVTRSIENLQLGSSCSMSSNQTKRSPNKRTFCLWLTRLLCSV